MILLNESKHGTVRISCSSLWESLASIRLVHSSRNATPWPYSNWLQATRRSIGREGLEISPWLLDLLQHLGGALPPFLTPAPMSAAPALEGELTILRATPAAQVRAELEQWCGDPPTRALQALHERPTEHLARLADVLMTYWDVALSGHATGMRSTYEEEIFARSRILATEGPERLLDSLDAGLPWPCPPGGDAPTPPVSEPMSRVRIVPLLFGRGPALMATGPDGVVCFSYQARGAAVLSGHDRMTDTGRKDRLEILLGRSRAAVMRAVIVPSTTSALAAELGLAASTVSEHLAVLVAAGVVKRRRVGIRVLYELDQVGMPLLGHLGGDPMDIVQADCA
jgi:DNA-binding transcriptional ArsR family regulator